MKILVIRHAEKDLLAGGDPGLSPKGERQAVALANAIEQGVLPRPTHLVASPKRRAQQTLQPLARLLSQELAISAALDERQSVESMPDFRRRVRGFLTPLGTAGEPPCLAFCTHLDWLDEMKTLLDCDADLVMATAHWTPASVLVLEKGDGLWHLQNFRGIDGA